jgi:ribonuclease J
VVVVVPLDHATGELLGDVEIVSSGFIDMDDSEELVDEATVLVTQALRSESAPQRLEESYITSRVRESLAGFLHKQTGRRPMIVSMPIDV